MRRTDQTRLSVGCGLLGDRACALALTDDQRTVQPGGPVEAAFRRYLITETKRRLHQPVFASQVMLAYETHCAVCALAHRELLDAAHIIPDSDPQGRGVPVVSNRLALCKIHRTSYDQNILGIRPDYVIEIHRHLLDEIDGPMLLHGLQDHHGKLLMQLPHRARTDPIPTGYASATASSAPPESAGARCAATATSRPPSPRGGRAA